MDASPDGGVILHSGGRDARVSFGVQGDVTVDGVGHYTIAEYGSTKAAAEAAYKVAAQKLDKAAGAGVIHKNQAANRKSGLAVAINAL